MTKPTIQGWSLAGLALSCGLIALTPGCGSSNDDLNNTALVTNTTVTATVSGSGSTTTTVTAPVNTSLAIGPSSSVTLQRGANSRLTLTLRRSDGSTQDLTESATWTSSEPSVATVSNTAGTRGSVTASSAAGGSTLITATINGISAVSTVNVSGAELVAFLANNVEQRVPVGFRRQLPVVAQFNDESTSDVSASVTYTVADASVVSCSSTGELTGLAAGTTTVTATDGSVSRAFPVTVSATTLTALRLTPGGATVTLAPTHTEDFTAVAEFADGTLLDATSQATFSSSQTAVATITGGGQLSSLTDGTTQVTASLGAITSSAIPVTVTTGYVGYTERRIPFTFRDISQSSTLVVAEADAARPLPITDFPLSFFGNTLSSATAVVASGGYLSFDPNSSLGGSNTTFPSPQRNAICLWNSHNHLSGFSKVEGVAPNRTLTVQFNGPTNNGSLSGFVGQILVYETSNVIDFKYARVAPESDATHQAGLQGADDAHYLPHSVNQANLLNSTAFRFIP